MLISFLEFLFCIPTLLNMHYLTCNFNNIITYSSISVSLRCVHRNYLSRGRKTKVGDFSPFLVSAALPPSLYRIKFPSVYKLKKRLSKIKNKNYFQGNVFIDFACRQPYSGNRILPSRSPLKRN